MEPFLVALYRLVDHPSRDLALLPAHDLHPTAFEVLVDMEEVLHFPQIMLRNVGDVEVLVVIRVVSWDCQDLVVGFPTIEHPQHPQWPAVDLASGKRRLVQVDEHIEWIAILVQGARNETIVTRIVDRGIEHPIETDHPARLVELVLVATAARNLDDRGDVVGGMYSSGQLVPEIDHAVIRCIVPL